MIILYIENKWEISWGTRTSLVDIFFVQCHRQY